MASNTKAKTLAYSPLITQAQINDMLAPTTAQMQLQQQQLLQLQNQPQTWLPYPQQPDPYNRSQWQLAPTTSNMFTIAPNSYQPITIQYDHTVVLDPHDGFITPPDPRLVDLGMQVLNALPYNLEGDIQLTHAQFLAATAFLEANGSCRWQGKTLVDVSA